LAGARPEGKGKSHYDTWKKSRVAFPEKFGTRRGIPGKRGGKRGVMREKRKGAIRADVGPMGERKKNGVGGGLVSNYRCLHFLRGDVGRNKKKKKEKRSWEGRKND